MYKKFLKTMLTTIGVVLGLCIYILLFYVLARLKVYDLGSTSFGFRVLVAIIFILIFALIFHKIASGFGSEKKDLTQRFQSKLGNVSTGTMMPGIIGLILGMVLAYLISRIYTMMTVPYLPIILTVLTYLILGYLGVLIGSSSRSKMNLSLFNLEKMKEAKGNREKSNPGIGKILDTSVIIDGRILDIMRTGFLEGDIIIPDFVLLEMQHVADSSDGLKRKRGRRGLDTLKRIQSEFGIEIFNTPEEKYLEDIPEVDIKLLKLAQHKNWMVVTNDYNLNKVAAIQEVAVLNINELANAVKPMVLPDETMQAFLVREGKGQNQAVAYLDDGTMIVVENGKEFIGQTIEVIVTNILQTAAGRMIFAKPAKMRVTRQ